MPPRMLEILDGRLLMIPRTIAGSLLALLLLAPTAALATNSVGQPEFDFTKNQLVGTTAGPLWTLSAQHGKVVILFVLGWF
jgi:hypothetical protein